MTRNRPAASFARGARGVEMYTRVSLYLFVPLEAFLYFYAVAALSEHDELPGTPALVALLAVCVAHMVACLWVVHTGFDEPLLDRGRAHPAIVVLMVVTTAVVVLAFLVLPGAYGDMSTGAAGLVGRSEAPGDPRGLTIAACGAGTFGALAVAFPFRRLAATALVVPALVLVPVLVSGEPSNRAVFLAVVAYTLTLFWTGTVRLSMWIVEVVRELEESRAVAGRLAVAEERLRISRDMHDVVGRALSAVAVKSELAAALARRGDSRAADEMDEVRTLAHDSLREVRGVVAGYRAPDLATELAGARSVLRAAGIAVRVVGDVPTLDQPCQEALAWVVREAVTNVVRHSRATECRLDLDHDGDDVVLRVTNDGVVPPDAGAGTPDGTGLTGLRERLAAVGGTLDVTTVRDRFTLTARIPTGAAA